MIQYGDLKLKYFYWLCNLVHDDNWYSNLSYQKLLLYLYNTEFTWLLEMDGNIATHGIDFRYRFGYETDCPRHLIDEELTGPCNILEMMVSLAFRVEEDIMDDNNYGNRTSQWFWNMIVSLGLGSMNDDNYDPYYIWVVITDFLNRQYETNGKGGLFTLEKSPVDMRTTDIWIQCMMYLDEFIENQ